MKCTSCNFVCSDLRDICPRCLIDLRSHKASIGLPISNPNAPYQILVEKFGPRPRGTENVEDGNEGFFQRIGSFFRDEPAPLDTPHFRPEEPSTSGTGHIQPDFGRYTALESAIDRRIDIHLEPHEPPLEEPVVVPAEPPTITPTESPTESDVVATNNQARATDDSVTRDREWLATLQVDEAEAKSDEINKLFTASLREIVQYDDRAQFEIGAEVFLSREHDEHIELLFDLADDEIVDPSSAKRLEARIETSADRHIESEELSSQLAKIEKVIDAKMPTLGAFQAESIATHPAEHAAIITPLQPPVPAGALRRIAAFAIDSVVVLAMVIGLTLAGIWTYEPQLMSILENPIDRDFTTYAFMIERAAPVFVVIVLFYPIILLAIFRRTIGGFITGIRLSSSDGHAPRFSGIMVRSFSLPLSALIGGSLPLLLGRETLHDHLSKTTFFRKPHRLASSEPN